MLSLFNLVITTPSPIFNPVAPKYEIGKLISGVIGGFILFGSILAFIYLLIGGLSWITSGGDKAGVEAARNKIINALIGLLLLTSVWAILTLIFPALGLSFPTISFPSIGRGLEGIR